jgi:hypothetical protein
LEIDEPLCSDAGEIAASGLKSIRYQIWRTQPDFAEHVVENLIGEFVRDMRRHRISVVLYVPPWPPVVQKMIDGAFAERMSRINLAMKKIAPVVTLPEGFVEHSGWSDIEHVCPETGKQFLDILLASGQL